MCSTETVSPPKSGIPEVLLLTGRQPRAGPECGVVEHLAGWAVAEEGVDLSEPAGPSDGGVGDVIPANVDNPAVASSEERAAQSKQ
jgi:hypothetical protein